MDNFQYGNDPKVEQMVSRFAEWEKEAMRIVYRFMEGEWDIDIHTFLDTKLASNADGWSDIDTIRDYHDHMKDEAKQDLRDGFNATFAIDFIRMVFDSLRDAKGKVN